MLPIKVYLTNNWGDKIAPTLVSLISNTTPNIIPIDAKEFGYLTVGSVLAYANRHTIVWGSGFISAEDKVCETPARILAVRGPHTRQRLLAYGIDCPEIYGDPVLLLPRHYGPRRFPRKEIGIVPHYIDSQHPWLLSMPDNVRVINMEGAWHQVVDEICSCDLIASSSLHGLIIADAYGIPSVWIKFSNNIIGGNWKFFDYFESVHRLETDPIDINLQSDLDYIRKKAGSYKDIKIDLEALYNSCPFQRQHIMMN